jgi:hypothetical protein
MKYPKAFGLIILAAVALAAFAGSASATTLTSPAGKTLGVGAKVKATLDSEIKIEGAPTARCHQSHLEGEIENPGGASSTVRVSISAFTMQECESDTYTVLKPGTLEIHTETGSANGNGIVTWDGAEITMLAHRIVFGTPVTTHCIYYTDNTPFGTLTGSKSSKVGTATLIANAELLAKETDGFCGGSIEWESSHRIGTPDYLDVD